MSLVSGLACRFAQLVYRIALNNEKLGVSALKEETVLSKIQLSFDLFDLKRHVTFSEFS